MAPRRDGVQRSAGVADPRRRTAATELRTRAAAAMRGGGSSVPSPLSVAATDTRGGWGAPRAGGPGRAGTGRDGPGRAGTGRARRAGGGAEAAGPGARSEGGGAARGRGRVEAAQAGRARHRGAARVGRAGRALDPRRGGGRLPKSAAAVQRGPPALRTRAAAAMRGGGSAAPSRRCQHWRLTPGPWLRCGGVGRRPCRAEPLRHTPRGAGPRDIPSRRGVRRGVIADHGRRR
jgi:hypothetical protein